MHLARGQRTRQGLVAEHGGFDFRGLGMFFSFSTFITSIFAIIGGLLNIFETSMWSYSLLIFASLFSLLFLNLTIIGIYLVRNIEETKKINDIVIEKETNFE